jgi:hypothetical protein
MEASEEFPETSINPFMDSHTYPAEEQIVHKSFMREAIAMVSSSPLPTPPFLALFQLA